MNIKAIETVYKGYRFRSRLEARWAVYFDEMVKHHTVGFEWTYEKEGFELGNGIRYLPDFWLRMGLWVEVKADKFTEAEEKKCRLLVIQTGKPCTMIYGVPGDHKEHACIYLEENPLVKHFMPTYALPTSLFNIPYAVTAARAARFENGEHGAR